jgi:magnesium-transporting ATPase (P-type)
MAGVPSPAAEENIGCAARRALGIQGDPLAAAIDVLARRLGIDVGRDERLSPPIRRFPFEARRRRGSIVTSGEVLVKGAPEAVLQACRESGEAGQVLKSMAGRGLRVLAVASKSNAGLARGGNPRFSTNAGSPEFGKA